MPALPLQATIVHLECPQIASNHPEVTCTSCKLKYLYTEDYTLGISGSPYYVVHNVYIGEDITFTKKTLKIGSISTINIQNPIET